MMGDRIISETFMPLFHFHKREELAGIMPTSRLGAPIAVTRIATCCEKKRGKTKNVQGSGS
jgi:hypothetical protein